MSSRLKQNQCRWAAAACVVALLSQLPPAVACGGEYNTEAAKIEFGRSTPADVLRVFGKPLEYRPFNSQQGKLSPDNLPDNYVMVYPQGLEVAITHGEVDELAFYKPSYKFRDAVQVGSTLDEVLEVVGQPLTTMVGHSGFCRSNILYKDHGGRKGSCIYRRQDLGVMFRFRDYRVTELCLSRPRGGESHDYRWIDLSKVNISERLAAAEDLEFNSATVWPPKNKLPRGFNPQKLLKDGMNPGLGVRAIHERGITGRGVNVAIIDQPLCQDHPEFDGKIAAYYDTGCGGSITSTHGPGMASLLVGTNCGTAPGARLYYAAAPSWKRDASYYARALDWIMEQNAQLSDSEKIRVVSVSAAPSGRGSPFTKNNEMWDEACARAEAANILVLDCTRHQGIVSRAFYDVDDPENISKCQPGVTGDIQSPGPDRVCTPACPRTKADQTDDDNQHTNGYTYVRRGGLSSSIPYTAGVLALGWQLRPELSAQQMREILFHTAHTSANGANIINPPAFIRFAESGDMSTIRPRARANSVARGSAAGDTYNAKVAQLDLNSATPDDVRRVFGEPFEYRWMRDTFSPDNLPDRYAMMYAGGVEVEVEQGHVQGLEFHQPNYAYRGSIRVGSSLDEVIQVVGEPPVTRVGQGGSYHKNVLHKDLDGEVGRCCYLRADQGLKIWFRDYQVVMIQLMRPEGLPEQSRGSVKARRTRRSDDTATADCTAKVKQLELGESTADDVLRIFGKPLEYTWRGETLSPTDLPDKYVMVYPDEFEVNIEWNKVEELEFSQPNYAFHDSIRVGSSLEDVIDVVGAPLCTMTGQDGFCRSKVLYRDHGGTKGRCLYRRPDQGVFFRFRDYKVSQITLSAPSSSFACDYRNLDLREADFSDQAALPRIVKFNQRTLWPPKDRMPANADPRKRLQDAMNPGLGIRAIHERGITGKGVNVAIIDQPLLPNHPEFDGKIAAYINLCDERAGDTSMHGPAVASLLVGTQCGTAPGARLYYAAAPSWTADSSYYARALDWIIEQSAQLPDSEKIRVVSVSAAPSGRGSPFKKNNEMWEEACARAEAAGIMVLDCTNTDRGLINPAWYDSSDPENVAKCTPGFPPHESTPDEGICTPCSGRTTAEQDDDDDAVPNSYVYWGRGGLSWSLPYATGVLALGWEVRPDLTPQEMRKLLLQSAHKTPKGARIIDPQAFIRQVEKAKRKSRHSARRR